MISHSSASGWRADETEADRATVVLHEQPVSLESLELEKALDDVGDPVERVRERRRVRHVAEPEARIVRRDHVEAVRQRAEQIAVLVRRRRKAVQQHELGIRRIARLAIGNVQSVDRDAPVESRT